jgi:hypothetical protein
MARVVIILDPNTGALIDVAGHSREDSRYLKFVKRMLSLDKNPILDYGNNGGDTLEISKGGSAGKAVNIKADVLEVTGDIKSNGKTIAEIIAKRISDVTSILRGKEGEIDVSEAVDEETGEAYVLISLDEAISSTIENLMEQLEAIREMPKKYVSKQSLSEALEGIEIHEEDTLEDVKAQFSALVRNLNAIASEADTESEEAEGEPDE